MFLRVMALLMLLMCTAPRSAGACAAAPPLDASVDILGEDAIIIWDPSAKQQQFIRRATFRSAANDFGFLVPTPSLPELSDAPDGLFERLGDFIDPGEVEENDYRIAWSLCSSLLVGSDRASKAPGAQVEVLAESRVAGYDAASLKAGDADALGSWLKEHGYAFRPALRDWLAAYVEQGWIINAFKVARTDDREVVGSRAVRMTFAAEQPYFPYREPQDGGTTYGRRLRIFLLTPSRHAANAVGTKMPAQLEHATPLSAALDRSGLLGVEPDWWLQVFVDRSARRPRGGDLTFRAEPGPEMRLPPRVRERRVVIPLFIDVIAFLGLLAYLFLRFRKARA